MKDARSWGMSKMYERSRDFVSFDNSNKEYFDIPKEEIGIFFDVIRGRWCYEYIDNNAFDLQLLNKNGGILFVTNYDGNWEDGEVYYELCHRFPDAEMTLFESVEDWYCSRIPNTPYIQ